VIIQIIIDMKFIRFKALLTYNRFISFLIGLMGFASSCIPEPMEYGMPHATFRLKGNVKSSNIEVPIPNIKVKMNQDSTYTDNLGNFDIKQTDFPVEQTFIVQFIDFDGNVNGSFKSIDTTITFENPVFSGGDGNWYEGTTEKVIEIKMNPLSNAK